jgi:phosphoribosylformimino-5-aminoimidazole carboxamide ribotide isomerase
VMTLAKVGANAGVDLPTMQYIREKTNKNSIYAAGGVRNLNDLLQLKQLGIKGALVASALHHHQISTTDLQSLVT